jgi:hypothetical protein
MSEFATATDEPNLVADESSVLDEHFPSVDEPTWSIPRDEWESVMGYIQTQQEQQAAWEQAQVADIESQQAAEWEQALSEYLDPHSDLYDPAAAQAMIAELAQQHVQPIVEVMNAAYAEQAHEALTNAIHDGFEASGIPEDRFEQAEQRANEVLGQMLTASEYDPGWAAAWQQVVASGDHAQIDAFVAYRDQLFAVAALEHTAEEWTRAQEVAGAKDEMALFHLRTAPLSVRQPQQSHTDGVMRRILEGV